MAQGSPLPTCSQCLDSKPHEIPPVRTPRAQRSTVRTHFRFCFQWIEEGGLGNDTIKLYQALQVDGRDGGPSALEGFHLLTFLFLVRITNDLTAEQVADLVAAYKSILESHASKLWSLAKNDEEEKLVFRQADLVDEMHRVCAECVNALAELAETLKESQPVRVACYWGQYVSFRHHQMHLHFELSKQSSQHWTFPPPYVEVLASLGQPPWTLYRGPRVAYGRGRPLPSRGPFFHSQESSLAQRSHPRDLLLLSEVHMGYYPGSSEAIQNIT